MKLFFFFLVLTGFLLERNFRQGFHRFRETGPLPEARHVYWTSRPQDKMASQNYQSKLPILFKTQLRRIHIIIIPKIAVVLQSACMNCTKQGLTPSVHSIE